MNLTVVHWNVWYRQDVRALPAFLAALNTDVLCLCELTINHPDQNIVDGPAWLAEQLDMHVAAMHLPLDTSDQPACMANAILTRHPLRDTRRVLVNEPAGTGGYDDEHRGYLEITLDLADPVTIGTTHLSYTHQFADTPRKLNEARRLAAALPTRRGILTGDLNTTPGTDAYATITEHLTPTGPPPATWTTKPFSYNGFTEDQLRWPLDTILITPDLTATPAEPIPTELSDHLPLRTTIST